MDEFTISFIDRADVTAPAILYKYRNWYNPKHRTILTRQEVYMAPPSSFKDEMEFRNAKRYDLMNDQQIFDKYMMVSRREHRYMTVEQHLEYAIQWAQKSPLRDINFVKQEQLKHFQQMDIRVGILSLTAFNNNIAMWNEYADKGKGFCVGFDTSTLFQYMGAGGQVQYYDDLPIIFGLDEPEIENWKQTYTKESKWSFEQEYRTKIFDRHPLTDIQRTKRLPKSCLREVIFGWAMPNEHVKAITNVCQSNQLSVNFYKASSNGYVVSIE